MKLEREGVEAREKGEVIDREGEETFDEFSRHSWRIMIPI